MKPYLIGIGGPSGAGKSFLAGHLARELRDATILPLDAYYPDLAHLSIQQRSVLNFDDPHILDTPLLFSQVAALARGETIHRPIYDFARHTRTPARRVIPPLPFVLIEGLFSLYWSELRTLLQTRVYLEIDDAISLERRVARDVRERGRTPQLVAQQFRTSVAPMANLYVRPTAQFADVSLYGATPIEDEIAAVLSHIQSRRPL